MFDRVYQYLKKMTGASVSHLIISVVWYYIDRQNNEEARISFKKKKKTKESKHRIYTSGSTAIDTAFFSISCF
jgi:hypothetical protein